MSKADISTTPIRSRRAVLAGIASAAAMPIVAAVPNNAVAFADPIFAALDTFRRVDAEFFAADGDDILDEVGERHHAAVKTMLRTRPTTPAGLAALTTWAREQVDYLHANASAWYSEDICTLVATIDDATRGMSGLKPWSPPSPAAAVAADPIYAAIERHMDLTKAYNAAWEVRAGFKDFGKMTEDEKAQLRQFNDATDAAHLPLEAAALDLINTVPTTQAGIIAALRYIQIQHGKGGEHMVEGRWEDENGERDIDWLDDWLKTLIESVSAVGGKGAQS